MTTRVDRRFCWEKVALERERERERESTSEKYFRTSEYELSTRWPYHFMAKMRHGKLFSNIQANYSLRVFKKKEMHRQCIV